MSHDAQDATIRFLSKPETFGVKTVDRLTTSISEIFFAGAYVYKLKRAVKLPYVDFSTLKARREACAREVELNRRTAPELYKGIAAVTRSGKTLALGGAGEPVDYLVHMARFDEDTLFDRLAARGALTDSHIIGLADTMIDLHLKAQPRPEYGSVDIVRAAVDNVIAPVRNKTGSPFAVDELDRVETAWQEALDRAAARIEIRRRQGYVRQCHGDLHLANICLFDGRPTPFDCIEFNDSIACIDTAFDAAFPVMDLIDHDRHALANLLLNRYLSVSGDYHALSLWPLYMSARAIVRAMVTALSDDAPSPSANQKARQYLALAAAFLRRHPPRLIALGGRSGTGKSTLARRLAPLEGGPAGAVWLRTDIIRKRLLGAKPEDRLGEDAYRPEVTAAVYRRMLRTAGRALRQGWSVVLDAVFLKPEERAAAEAVAKAARVPFHGLWLEAPLDLRIAWIRDRRGDASDADVRVARLQEKIPSGVITWRTLHMDDDSANTFVEARRILEI